MSKSYTEEISEVDLSDYEVIDEEWDWWFFHYVRSQTVTLKDGTKVIPAFVYFGKKIFIKDVILSDKYAYKISFRDCYFKGDLRFVNAICEQSVVVTSCFVDKYFSTGGEKCEFQKQFNIQNLKVKNVIIEGGSYNDCNWNFIDFPDVFVNKGNFVSLEFGGGLPCELNCLRIHLKGTSGNIFVSHSDSKIRLFTISHYSKDTNITIDKVNVNVLNINSFRNDGTLRLLGLKAYPPVVTSEFSVTESYLGKAEFYDIDFRQFHKFHILDSHLIDCSFVNIDWKFNILPLYGTYYDSEKYNQRILQKLTQISQSKNLFKSNLKQDGEVITYYNKKREVYRQLKFASGKQGNNIDEQKFHSQEMKSYSQTLVTKKLETKLIIWFSSVFSDFGQSLGKPIVGLLLGHWLLFLVLITLKYYPNIYLSTTNPTWNGFKIAFGEYWRLINPLRRPENFEGYYSLLDIFMRVWASYMIYNIVRASRRFMK